VPRDEELHEDVLDILTGCCLHQVVGDDRGRRNRILDPCDHL
jgi:hypothetical protein